MAREASLVVISSAGCYADRCKLPLPPLGSLLLHKLRAPMGTIRPMVTWCRTISNHLDGQSSCVRSTRLLKVHRQDLDLPRAGKARQRDHNVAIASTTMAKRGAEGQITKDDHESSDEESVEVRWPTLSRSSKWERCANSLGSAWIERYSPGSGTRATVRASHPGRQAHDLLTCAQGKRSAKERIDLCITGPECEVPESTLSTC